MKTLRISVSLCAVLCLAFFITNLGYADPMGTAITYQGRLMDDDVAADGSYDMQFRLYNALTDPSNMVALTVSRYDVPVENGFFTVTLDFYRGNAFNGDARFLGISIRPSSSSGSFE